MQRAEFTIEDVARGRTMTITDLHDLGGQVFECNKVSAQTTIAEGFEESRGPHPDAPKARVPFWQNALPGKDTATRFFVSRRPDLDGAD
jgi:hypothetical protein|tara:strand:- start:22457 stop:22723 length:267 start_codon:yes stop_codon:yes gene_type:complete